MGLAYFRPQIFSLLTPARMFVTSFAALILFGTLLLMFPFSSTRGLSLVDALFTATSAVCVTGLSVLDLGKDLSTAGQIVTMFLFQVGGLGIMTFSVILFALMGKGISFKGREIVQETFLHKPRRHIVIILKAIFVYTAAFELVGIICLFIAFSRDYPVGEALYQATYHAVSAYVNCGFSLFSDSLMRYQGDWLVNLTVMTLLVAGGIGFVVQHEVYVKLRGSQGRWSIHTRLVLITTGILIASGAIVFYVSEYRGILRGMPVNKQILVSLFQSVTPRTCGFNTVDYALLANETILATLVLMFIGASPGSTGGGIKTTSAAVLFLMMWNRLAGNERVNVFNRTIPEDLISKTMSIVFASAFSVCLVASFLLLSHGAGAPSQSRHLFVEYLFETVSAFGTVGLSMGITSKMNDPQKIAIILLMFAGRVGPLTLAYTWVRRRLGKPNLLYAEESLLVG
jgi:trk system potassium uptake protein